MKIFHAFSHCFFDLLVFYSPIYLCSVRINNRFVFAANLRRRKWVVIMSIGSAGEEGGEENRLCEMNAKPSTSFLVNSKILLSVALQ
jgi:hypothetical protein